MKKKILKCFSFISVILALFIISGCTTTKTEIDFEQENNEFETFISKNTYETIPVLSVTSTKDGLLIRKHHNPVWTYVSIHVRNLQTNKENVYISTTQYENEFLYPFVEEGQSYLVYIIKQEEDWTNWSSFEDDGVIVTALGGLGDFYITYSDYKYVSSDYSIEFDNLQFIKPDITVDTPVFSGNICDEGYWEGDSVWSEGFTLTDSSLSLEKIKLFLLQKKKIFVSLTYTFSYENIDYEFLLLENKDNYFVDNNEIYIPIEKTSLVNVYISTDDKRPIAKNNWKSGKFKIVKEDGTIVFEQTEVQLKGRGNSSWGTGKNPYSLKFKKAQSILGMKKNKKWVLMANYFDRAMIRNRFAGFLGTEVFDSTWNAVFTPVNLYVNGIYNGTYDFGERIEIAKNRVNIPSLKKEGINGGGFIAEIDCRNKSDRKFYSAVYKLPVNLRDPDEITDREFDFVKHVVNDFEKMLDSKDFASRYENYIDVDSVIDWWIINELSRSSDAIFQTSVFFYYNPNDRKIHMGPNWDFDIAFGNMWDETKYNEWYIYGGFKWMGKENPELAKMNNGKYQAYWINRLFEDEKFKQRVKNRWMDKADDLYFAINSKIQQYSDEIELTIPDNEKLLPRLGKYSWNGPENYESRTTYKQEVEYMLDWVNKRYEFMNNEISKW